MNIRIATLFILLTFFIHGCEDSTVDKQNIKDPPNVVEIQKQVAKEIKPSPILHKPVKKVVKKKKSPRPKVKKPVDSIDDAQNPRMLDLSLPHSFQQSTVSKSTSNYKQQDYLPDFFKHKKNYNNKPIQIDGKIITREEQEIDKQTTIDGVGIGIKLNP